ncbi:MAG: hypothetical protein Q4P20_02900 [Eubacteriales bacterium]|nr:hypothetical protein [Eubacteriales bacterium]
MDDTSMYSQPTQVHAARGAFGVMERKRGCAEESPENHRFFGVERE